MTTAPTRRQLLLGTLGILAAGCISDRSEPAASPVDGAHELAALEAQVGGRLGVFALDTRSGRQLAFRADERFAMCSTFKWVLAAAVLAQVDRGQLRLDERVPYGPTDLLEYAPVTRKHVTEGAMTVEALAEAAVVLSDNTAANLLLAKTEGPAGLTQFIRANGDTVTRLDRKEPALNDVAPGDPRDTTSPRAMVALLRRVLCEGDTLSVASRDRLYGWMRACETGKRRIRAGLPTDWQIGDKTGSGPQNALNDVAIAVPRDGAPILIAVYTFGSTSQPGAIERIHADVARKVARMFRP
ncbi:MAG: class A beta-lactamase [Polyangiaceae bacterium]